MLRRVRCGQDSLVACRLASSGDVRDDAATSLLRAHSIIARVHFHHRRQMLETLVGVKESVMHNGYACSSLARHDPHSQEDIPELGKFYSVDHPWELCPDTCDARHVCARYPRATAALLFADGFACWTKKNEGCAGTSCSVGYETHFHQNEGEYGVVAHDHWAVCFCDVLLRRRLPY